MKRTLFTLSLALIPAVAGAQTIAPPSGGPPLLSQQQRSQIRQLQAQMKQNREQLRARILSGLTPAQRSSVANIIGQLALAPSPNRDAARQAVDNVLTPGARQSILALATSERSGQKAMREQQKAIFESSLIADQKAASAQREAQHRARREAFVQAHPRPQFVPDAGAVVLHTLADEGGHGRHHHRMM